MNFFPKYFGSKPGLNRFSPAVNPEDYVWNGYLCTFKHSRIQNRAHTVDLSFPCLQSWPDALGRRPQVRNAMRPSSAASARAARPHPLRGSNAKQRQTRANQDLPRGYEPYTSACQRQPLKPDEPVTC
jgi:hypothetical protein